MKPISRIHGQHWTLLFISVYKLLKICMKGCPLFITSQVLHEALEKRNVLLCAIPAPVLWILLLKLTFTSVMMMNYTWFNLKIPHASLWKPDKPWSLLPKACFHDQHSLDDPHILMSKGDTNSAPIHQSDIGRCTHTGLIQLSETVDTKMPNCFNSDAQPDITSVSPMAQPEEVQAEVLPLTDLHDDSSWHWIVQFFTRDLQPLFLPSLGQMYHPHKKQMVASSFVRHFLGLHAQSQGSSF